MSTPREWSINKFWELTRLFQVVQIHFEGFSAWRITSIIGCVMYLLVSPRVMARYLDCGCWTGLMTRPPLAFKDFHLSILTSLDSVETVPGGGARLDWKCKRLLLLRIYFYSPSGHYFSTSLESGCWTPAPHRNTRGQRSGHSLALSALHSEYYISNFCNSINRKMKFHSRLMCRYIVHYYF